MKSTPHPPRARPQRQRARAAAASLTLALQTGSGVTALPASRAQFRRWVLAVLESDADLTLRFVNRAEACALNAGYRKRSYAPDVLTFIYENTEPRTRVHLSGNPRPRLQADIVLCVPVLREQARRAGWPLAWRLAHLVIHGVLHAQGHDHEQDEDARRMQSLESLALRRFRIPDPYAETP